MRLSGSQEMLCKGLSARVKGGLKGEGSWAKAGIDHFLLSPSPIMQHAGQSERRADRAGPGAGGQRGQAGRKVQGRWERRAPTPPGHPAWSDAAKAPLRGDGGRSAFLSSLCACLPRRKRGKDAPTDHFQMLPALSHPLR